MGPVLHYPDWPLSTASLDDAQDVNMAALDAFHSLIPRCVNPFYASFSTTQAASLVFTKMGVFSGKVFMALRGPALHVDRVLVARGTRTCKTWSRVDDVAVNTCTSKSVQDLDRIRMDTFESLKRMKDVVSEHVEDEGGSSVSIDFVGIPSLSKDGSGAFDSASHARSACPSTQKKRAARRIELTFGPPTYHASLCFDWTLRRCSQPDGRL
ncbi:hypothetical protein PsorP6_002977 [Peronosclerospora sorghi]|uniref:Uncharacterized protein n=1 Tax=Peronosclerospora sorghi TaxID=230839 RepID=A0ACC0VIR3_9STRA|nr:hypothetical protein PsorP6_002977 [Peronosclerospora sorghi]